MPPGFRFHPTEEELVGYYLKSKVNSLKIDPDVIVDIDLYRMQTCDIQYAHYNIIILMDVYKVNLIKYIEMVYLEQIEYKLGYEEQNKW